MKLTKLIVLFPIPFLLAILVSSVTADPTCSGTGCNGLNPNSTGCDASATTLYQTTNNGAKLELRKSTVCSTYWAKTTNVSGVNKYANATLKYYYYSYSPAPIPNYQYVYSSQRYGTDGAYMNACGQVSNSIIDSMIYSPCVP
ncbi:MAG TPA: DUF2690 domain-containing protein [Anaerolineaceae bacterium]|nr:DUF2690 domain-containing protein [Anaerolineaceae bacterium]HNZ01407.1 DUF2690 domain-containing protein [Anaerolineaceae bacterium]HOD43576.1 DUF2690 domain-containing protein [Anaerolineaceae bacterium]HOH20590.1 DUF2690 domain-containing protein [Anaerolineaceae bacterium]HOU44825.1 DUF2690 domain-containing protein [Anaerolineaceae bacterium]